MAPAPFRVPGRAPAQAMCHRPFPQLTLPGLEALRGRLPQVALRRAAARVQIGLPGFPALALAWNQAPPLAPAHRRLRQLAPPGAAPLRPGGRVVPRRALLRLRRRPAARARRRPPVSPPPVQVLARASGPRSFRQLAPPGAAPLRPERPTAPGRDRAAERAELSPRSSPPPAARPPGGGRATADGPGDRETARAIRLQEPHAARIRRHLRVSPAPVRVLGRAPGHRPSRQPTPPGTAPRRPEAPHRAALRLRRRPAARVQRRPLVSPPPVQVLARVLARTPGPRPLRQAAPSGTAPQRRERRAAPRRAALRLRRPAARVQRRPPVSPPPVQVLRRAPARTPGPRPLRQLEPPGAAPQRPERRVAPGRDRGAHQRPAERAGVSRLSSPSPAAPPSGGGRATAAGPGDRETEQAARLQEPHAARLPEPPTAPERTVLRLRRRSTARIQRRLPVSPPPVHVLGPTLRRSRQLAPPCTAPQRTERQAAPRRAGLRLRRRPAAQVQRSLPVSPPPVRTLGRALAQAPRRRSFRQLAPPGEALRRAALRLRRRPTAQVQRRLPVPPAPVRVPR